MEHLSSEALTAFALGHTEEGAQHLESCAACRAEVVSLRAAVVGVRSAAVSPAAPPAGLWDRIAAEIDTAGIDAAQSDEAQGDEVPAAGAVAAAPVSPSAVPPAVRDGAHVARRRRRFSAGALLAASAASALVAASIAVLAVVQLNPPPRSAAVASAQLDALASGVAPASAEIVERDGQRLLIVDADALPDVEGYLDVWLLDAQAQQMVSLGVMDAETAQLTLPAQLDLAAFPIVDVSIEPYDGDPTHSGNSIWRGALEG